MVEHLQVFSHVGFFVALVPIETTLRRRGSLACAYANGGDDVNKPQPSSNGVVVNQHNVDTVTLPPVPPPLPETHASLCVRSFGLTDVGKVRASNEDQFLTAVLLKALQVDQTSLPQKKVQHSSDRGYLFVVADGMGGHAGGEQASALAVDSVETFILGTFKWFAQFKGPEQDQVLSDFQTALGQANARVLAEAEERSELHGMGTTLTLAYSRNDGNAVRGRNQPDSPHRSRTRAGLPTARDRRQRGGRPGQHHGGSRSFPRRNPGRSACIN